MKITFSQLQNHERVCEALSEMLGVCTTTSSLVCSLVTAQRQFQGENPLELSNPCSKVVGWILEVPGYWELQAGWSFLLSEHSSSGAGKNSQKTTSWLHHFLAFKVKKASGEICPCLFLTGHIGPH